MCVCGWVGGWVYDLGVGCGPVTYHTKVLRRKTACDSVTGHYVYVEVSGRGG